MPLRLDAELEQWRLVEVKHATTERNVNNAFIDITSPFVPSA